MKPDAKLASEFQRRKRVRVIAAGLVNRPVTRFAECVENVSSFFRNDALIREAAKRFFKGLAFAKVERVMGGSGLAQKLGKLAQFEERRAGIVAKVSLRQRPKLHQLGVVHAQKSEIARRQHRSPAAGLDIYWRSGNGLQPRRRLDRRTDYRLKLGIAVSARLFPGCESRPVPTQWGEWPDRYGASGLLDTPPSSPMA